MAHPNNQPPPGYYPQGSMPYIQPPPFYGMPMPSGQQQPMHPPPGVAPAKGSGNVPGRLPAEESYIENILRLNKGKLVEVYTTYEHNTEWNAKIFKGVIEAAGRDYVILSDPQTGNRVLIPMVNVDFVIFQEPIDYEYHFPGPSAR
ncbi:spore coat protein GerQ [Siminovitchia sediminis]|uniref:Spore coat protein GerQ n=1 Tax=Siminovitchia sediminis TaxID=1274353 RepID=A0ABW4KL12_9BACI